jgi:hypothetical protein
VFPFSRRPGTAAWDYKPRVPEREAEKRVSILKNYAVLSRKRYIERWIGRKIGGVCMSSSTPAGAAASTGAGAYTGVAASAVEVLTDNYLRVLARLSPDSGVFPRKGGRLDCIITAGRDCADGEAQTLIDAYGEIPDW